MFLNFLSYAMLYRIVFTRYEFRGSHRPRTWLRPVLLYGIPSCDPFLHTSTRAFGLLTGLDDFSHSATINVINAYFPACASKCSRINARATGP